jgi:hypothetical protein
VVVQNLTESAGYHFFAGEWGLARAHAQRAATMMRQIDRGIYYYLLIATGTLDLAEGREQDAEQHLREGLALAAREGDVAAQRHGQWVLAERDLLIGGRAADTLACLEPLLDRPGMRERYVEPLLPLVAWAQLGLDRDDEAAATLAAAKARCGRLWLVDVLRVEGMLAIKQGRWDDAAAGLDEALAMSRAMPYPYGELKALYVSGQLHATKGEPMLAREKYQAALCICERLGEGLYRPHIERALAELPAEAPAVVPAPEEANDGR